MRTMASNNAFSTATNGKGEGLREKHLVKKAATNLREERTDRHGLIVPGRNIRLNYCYGFVHKDIGVTQRMKIPHLCASVDDTFQAGF